MTPAQQAEGLGNAMQDYLAANVPVAERCKMALSVAMTYAFMNRWEFTRVVALARATFEICKRLGSEVTMQQKREAIDRTFGK